MLWVDEVGVCSPFPVKREQGSTEKIWKVAKNVRTAKRWALNDGIKYIKLPLGPILLVDILLWKIIYFFA